MSHLHLLPLLLVVCALPAATSGVVPAGLTAASDGRTFYVSPNGSDASSGLTPSASFATLSRAFLAAEGSPGGPATTILLAGGVYERTSAVLSASAGPVTVRALDPGGAPAVLSGGARVHGWAPVADAPLPSASHAGPSPLVWSAPLPSGVGDACTLLCERGGAPCRTRARTPNAGSTLTWAAPLCPTPSASFPACREAARWGFVFAPGDVSPALYDLERVEVSVFGGWTASRHRVAAVFDANSTVLLRNPSNMPIGQWANHNSEGGGRYFLDNVLEGLDEPGEWYCDIPRSRVLYAPRPNEEALGPAQLELYLALSLEVVAAANVSDVALEGPGIVVAHAAWACDFAGAQVCDWQSTTWQTYAAVHVRNASRVRLTGLEVAGVGGAAVWLDDYTHDATISGCFLHDLAAGGVRIAGARRACANGTVSNVVVADNVIGTGGLIFPDGTGVLVAEAQNVTVAHNEIAFLSFTGVSLGWCWGYNNLDGVGGHAVYGNAVHDLGSGSQRLLGDAMACFYSLGQLSGSDVHHNTCVDVRAYYTGGFGTSQDQASSGYGFHHNVVVRTTGAGVNQHYGVGNAVWNNIVVDSNYESATANNRGSVRSYAQADLPSSFNFTRNVVYQTNATAACFADNYMPWLDVGGGDAGGPPGHGSWRVAFADNVWFNLANASLPHLPVWGGSSVIPGVPARQLSLDEWRRGCGTSWESAATAAGRNCSAAHLGPGQDVRSVFADPLFADARALNFTLLEGSPALALGFEQVDVSSVGPQRRDVWPPLMPPSW